MERRARKRSSWGFLDIYAINGQTVKGTGGAGDIHTANYKSYHTTTPNGLDLQISNVPRRTAARNGHLGKQFVKTRRAAFRKFFPFRFMMVVIEAAF